jgi:hypothetical protein
VLVLGLFVAAPSVAAAKVIPTHETVDGTVTWTLPAGQCPSLPAGVSVSGTGERHRVTTTLPRADGSTTIITNDLVKGTAVDSTGRTYQFVYQNHSTETRPPSGSLVQIRMTDTFVLHGPGGGPTLNVGFSWRWTYTPPNFWPPADNWEQLSTRGDPLHCDPI